MARLAGQADRGSGPRCWCPATAPIPIAPAQDLKLTRDYLVYLRQRMGEAVADFAPFDEAYAKTDWSRVRARCRPSPTPTARNAYNTYLLLEREALEKR
ncbi:MAG: hypothetical protein MZW92_60635 [Comamonadaceae bacterium]|nr:hypothetical protein [Comamonadaceae bacterium]